MKGSFFCIYITKLGSHTLKESLTLSCLLLLMVASPVIGFSSQPACSWQELKTNGVERSFLYSAGMSMKLVFNKLKKCMILIFQLVAGLPVV